MTAGMVRFDGDATVFYVAICQQCDMAIPFGSEAERKAWLDEHSQVFFEGKRHVVKVAVDVRPDPVTSARRKDSMVAALREKYARPAKLPAGPCGNPDCRKGLAGRMILPGDKMVSFAGKFYHAECVDDSAYLRIASITDIMPGIFDQVPPVKIRRWISGDPNPPNPLATLEKTLQEAARKIPAFIVTPTLEPKKMNARERRREKRRNKQWTK
jgi:hypothetical protein